MTGVSDISGHSSKNSSEPVAHPNEKDSDGDSISERWAQVRRGQERKGSGKGEEPRDS